MAAPLSPQSAPQSAPHQLLDDGYAPEPCEVLVVGCGNILRGDDAVGPMLIRELATRQAAGEIPEGTGGVRLVDGGTAGMDVAFGMRGARRVVLVDAARTGNEPGKLYRLPDYLVAQVPPLEGLHTHNFRWDHALAFADWLLGPEKPQDITVFLIEAGRFGPGEPLTEPVADAVAQLIGILEREFWSTPTDTSRYDVELTDAGCLLLPATLAAERFPGDVCLARVAGAGLELMPLHDAAYGGLVMKQRNAAGDRSVLVNEVLGFDLAGRIGTHPSTWDAERGTLVIDLAGGADDQRVRRSHAGGLRAGPLGGLSDRDQPGGRGATGAPGLSDRGEGAAGGRRRPQDGRAPSTATTRSGGAS